MTAAIFLDRDNTLIHNDGDLGDVAQVRLIKGTASAIASLRGLGYKIVVVSNQGGVARGRFSEADVQAVNERISQLVKVTSGSTIDRFYYCPYHPEGKVKKYRREHPWRKPQPGMLLQAAEDLQLDLSRSWMIGDQLRDVQAAAAAGVRAILLTSDPGSLCATQATDGSGQTPEGTSSAALRCNWSAPTMIEAVKIIAQQGRTEHTPSDATVTDASRTLAAASGTRRDHQPGTSAGRLRPQTQTSQSSRGRPFRPWAIQPADDASPTQSADDPPQTNDTQVSTTPSMDGPVDPASVLTRAPETSSAPPAGRSLTPIGQVLRQILQELRNQRTLESEFSYHHMTAIVLQMVAAVCLLAALWMGGTSLDLFLRWVAVAIVVQLATVAMLLFRR